MVYLSARRAQRGRCSPISMPVTLVLIGLYGPRISTGASGFRSHMSMVLGPPSRKRKMHAFAFGGVSVAAVAAHWNSRGRLSPASSPDAPSRSACRRVMPSQWRAELRPNGTNMPRPPYDFPFSDICDCTPSGHGTQPGGAPYGRTRREVSRGGRRSAKHLYDGTVE